MKNPISLCYINQLAERLDANSPFIQVVLGARQVGKTTTVLKLIEDKYQHRALYVSADQVFNADANWIQQQWLSAQSTNKILFIDEIQKSHNWAEAIKALYDESKRNKKLLPSVLLGSSSLAIQKGLTESLTGRFQLIRAHHWNYQESKEGYDLSFEDYLHYGGYPGSYQLIGTPDWVDYVKNSIIATAVEKDILQFQTVKNPALFKQAFDILTSYPAQEISYTKLLGQLQDKGNVELIKYYISLYEGAFLIKALEKFSNKSFKRKSSSPKILPLAPCMSYLENRTSYSAEEKGRIFELLVGSQLVRTGENLYYWREGKNEVDFVLKKGRTIWAIEVKSGRKKSTKGLEQFKKLFPTARLSLITKENYFEFEKDPLLFLDQKF
jgi:predicted AAA+ superfamily ATPase